MFVSVSLFLPLPLRSLCYLQPLHRKNLFLEVPFCEPCRTQTLLWDGLTSRLRDDVGL